VIASSISSFKIQLVKFSNFGLSYTAIVENGKEKVTELWKCLHNLPFKQTSSKILIRKQSIC
jgi:hypothetical protein